MSKRRNIYSHLFDPPPPGCGVEIWTRHLEVQLELREVQARRNFDALCARLDRQGLSFGHTSTNKTDEDGLHYEVPVLTVYAPPPSRGGEQVSVICTATLDLEDAVRRIAAHLVNQRKQHGLIGRHALEVIEEGNLRVAALEAGAARRARRDAIRARNTARGTITYRQFIYRIRDSMYRPEDYELMRTIALTWVPKIDLPEVLTMLRRLQSSSSRRYDQERYTHALKVIDLYQSLTNGGSNANDHAPAA